MPRLSPIQTNFTSGEISPRLEGRVDFEKYFDGCSILHDFILHPHGGIKRRPGSYFAAEVKNSANVTRVIPFVFNAEQSYIIELGNLYMRFYKDGGQITNLGAPVEIVTPYTSAQLWDIQFCQSADTMYLVHNSHKPRVLTRTSDISWSLNTITFTDGPYLKQNDTATTITPSATSGSITLTASASLFQAAHVGALFRLQHSTTWGHAVITSYTSPTLVNASVLVNFGALTATAIWREGAWSDVRGYPGSVTFYEDRLIFAGSAYSPTTLWGSASGDYENMTPGTADDDAIDYTIASRQVNVVRWLAPTTKLIVGTFGGEFSVSSTNGAPLSPTNVSISPQSSYGTNGIQPAQAGNTVLYMQRAGKKMREMTYSWEINGFQSEDVTILSEHITGDGIDDIAYQQEPDSIVWLVRADGVLIGMTYERSHKVVGWHRHSIGGDGIVESIAVIPEGAGDVLWMVVRRTINGVSKRYIEFLDSDIWANSTLFGWNQLQTDCALVYVGTPTTNLTGLSHLEGKTVKILADGATHPDKVVTSGAIQLDYAASEVEVGLYYESVLKTVRPEGGIPGNTGQGKKKRWNEVIVRFYETLGGKVNGDIIPYRSAGDPMDHPPPVFTGDKRITNLGWDTDGQIEVIQDQPLPMSILMISGTLTINE